MDLAGNVYLTTDSFEPVTYYKQGHDDADWTDQGNGVLLTRSGPNKLKVENTSHFGPLAIIKQVPEVSLEAAEGQEFVFHVELLLPPGMELKLLDLVTENGTISDFTCEGEIAEFTVTVQGAGMVLIDGIPFDTIYKVNEISTPEGWKQQGESVYSDADKLIMLNDEPMDSVTITNIEITSITVEKAWKQNGLSAEWPEDVTAVTVGLYRSVNGEEPEPVTDEEGNPLTLTFGEDAEEADRTFAELPVYDADGRIIAYSVQEISLTGVQETAAVRDDAVTLNGKTWEVTADEPDEEGTAVITNSRTVIHILKVDRQAGEPLAGAEFRLEKLNGETWEVFRDEIATGTEGEELGLAIVDGLTEGRYTLSETKAPAGYIPLGMPVGFTVQDGAVVFENTDYVTYDRSTATFRVQNKIGLAMPSTGGPGTLAWTAGGLALILLAGGLLLRRKRKNIT
ncbi:MAG: Cna B-type domain-containing protein, partial [Clostridia bacterium]|nr:Cna B-type domain-containing protein [Clostridia bacterium]